MNLDKYFQIRILDDDSKELEEGYPSDVSSGSDDSDSDSDDSKVCDRNLVICSRFALINSSFFAE